MQETGKKDTSQKREEDLVQHDILRNRDVHEIKFLDRTIFLVGTAHVSKESQILVKKVILETRPDILCIELDERRFDAITDPNRWQNLNIFDVIRKKQTFFLIAKLLLAGFQKKIGQKLGVRPGSEMLEAVHAADAFAVTQHGHYKTPLALVEIDEEMVQELAAQISINRVGADQEHSLEIQLPFLQRALPHVKVLPIMMGAQDMGSCRALAKALADIAGKRKTLFIASTDLAHVTSQRQALALDKVFMADFDSFDPQRLANHLASGETSACGGGPVVAIMLAAQALGADQARILHHATSYDVTGDESYVVGYAAGVLLASA